MGSPLGPSLANAFLSYHEKNWLNNCPQGFKPVFYRRCGLCNESYYGESIKHLDIRSGEHIGVSPLTGKKVRPSNNSAICDHLLHCNFLPSFDNFSVLAHENKKYLLEIKESLVIMRDKPSLNRNINSAPLYLFDKVS